MKPTLYIDIIRKDASATVTTHTVHLDKLAVKTAKKVMLDGSNAYYMVHIETDNGRAVMKCALPSRVPTLTDQQAELITVGSFWRHKQGHDYTVVVLEVGMDQCSIVNERNQHGDEQICMTHKRFLNRFEPKPTDEVPK